MFGVLNSMVITVDHCTLTHSRSIVCYLLSIATKIKVIHKIIQGFSGIFSITKLLDFKEGGCH